MTLRYLSVCSGIEAATVAWHPLGWEAAAFSEIAPFPSAVLKHRFPNVPNLGDMTSYKEWDIGPVQLLVGGTPCQSFSVAGLRKGMDDPRGNLALVFLGIAARLRPAWVVWENVPGVRSSGGGRDFGSFLGGLAELGYGWAYRSLDAQYFGLAQRRERVFVVGHLGDWRRAAAVLFERESLSGHPAPSRETGQGVAACLTRGADSGGKGGYAGRRREDDVNIVAPTIPARTRGGGGLGTDFDCDGGLIPQTANPLTARMHKGVNTTCDEGQTMIAHALRSTGFDASEDGTGRGTPLVPIAFGAQMSNPHWQESDVCQTLQRKNPAAVAFQTRIARNGRGQPKEITDALTSSDGGTHADSKPHVAGPMGVRRLTPRECERLQGFPDDWTLVPYRGKPAADGPRYSAIGNSMAVPVMRWIGQRIEEMRS